MQSIETWFDPWEMFRQIARDGKVERESGLSKKGVDLAKNLDDMLKPDITQSHLELHKGLSNTSAAECPFLAQKE